MVFRHPTIPQGWDIPEVYKQKQLITLFMVKGFTEDHMRQFISFV